MRHSTATRGTGLFIAAMVFLFTLTTFGQASARDASLKSQLSKNGISMKIVKLDREDGFRYGLSFKGKNKTIVIAPGYDRMMLVRVDGNEAILQADGTGNMQIIQADIAAVDLNYVLCVADAVIGFLRNVISPTQCDAVCYITAIFTLFSDVASCDTGVTP